MKHFRLLFGLLAAIIAGAGCRACDSNYPDGPVAGQGDCPDGLCDIDGRAGSVFGGQGTVEVVQDGSPPPEALAPTPSE